MADESISRRSPRDTVALEMVPSDRVILDLLRQRDAMTVTDFEQELGVTATAVRQRLNRLLGMELIERFRADGGASRGRPSHGYRLTEQGRRKTGTSFAELAVALWQEIRAIRDESVRRGLLQRLAVRLADVYRDRVNGAEVAERARQVVQVFADRQIPFSMEQAAGELPVLRALACPYPDLAEQDRSICAMERLMFAELLGSAVVLSDCRLDGATCCTFQLRDSEPSTVAVAPVIAAS